MIKLSNILNDVVITEVVGRKDISIKGVALHSGQVQEGFLFIAIRGEKSDGHTYIDDAVKRGAVAVVCETFPESSAKTTIIVKDSRIAASKVAANFYGHPSRKLRTVGITGTNGKTTVAYLCRNILASAGEKTGLIGTIEYIINGRTIPAERTTPDSVLIQSLLREMADDNCKAVTMEVSSHSLVQHRVDDVEFDAGIFTNLTRDHLDYHKTMEEYLNAKVLLFRKLVENKSKNFAKTAIINVDDSASVEIIKNTGASIIRYGIDRECDVRASNIKLSTTGSTFNIKFPDTEVRTKTSLIGRHNIYNILASAGMAISQGIPIEAIIKGIEKTNHVSGRLQFIPNKLGISVVVDYAHTDDALKNVIGALREFTKGRIIVVFGCGGDRDPGKRPKMGRVVGELSDMAIVTSDNPRSEDPEKIIKQVSSGIPEGFEYIEIIDRKEAIRRAIEIAERDDTVLIAGKGHETYQQFKNNIVIFDDREVAAEIISNFEAAHNFGGGKA